MNRRELLYGLGALPFTGASCSRRVREAMTTQNDKTKTPQARMPAVFAAHGAPILLDDAVWMGELAAWAKAMPKPKSILMVSAHWEARPASLGATQPVPLVYDFYGFPEKYYQTKYPAPGAPELASRVRELLRARDVPVTDGPRRGLDHGAYVPLVAMYPSADVPVRQLSMPGLDAQELFELATSSLLLPPLRDEGVLVFGSGLLAHNMRLGFRPGTPQWAREFDGWAEEALSRLDTDTLIDLERRAPAARMALPTWVHCAPVLVATGTVDDEHPTTTFPLTGWGMDGAFTKCSVHFGSPRPRSLHGLDLHFARRHELVDRACGDRPVERGALLVGHRSVEGDTDAEAVLAPALLAVIPLDVGLDAFERDAATFGVPGGGEGLASGERGIEVVVRPWRRVRAPRVGAHVSAERVRPNAQHLGVLARLLGRAVDGVGRSFAHGAAPSSLLVLNPTRACVPSQYGLFAEWPQRQSAVFVVRFTVLPVPAQISRLPSMRSGPSGCGVTVSGPARCARG